MNRRQASRGAPAQGGGNASQQNAIARHQLRTTAPLMRKKLGTFTQGGALGGNTRIKLFNVGLLTKVILRVSMTYTVGTATATLSGKGPHAAISRLKLIDFDGSDRINISGYHLFLRNCLRGRSIFGLNKAGTGNIITEPNVPTAVGAQTATFFVEVPVCANFEQGDLRGLMLMQTAVGEVYLSLDWASALYGNANDDVVFNGAATTTVGTVSFSVEAWQEYYLPQAQNGNIPLPRKDLLTVYELAGMTRSTTDFASGTEKLVNLPNVREVVGAYHSYLRNSIFPGSAADDIGIHRLIANGNNVLTEASDQLQYFQQRNMLNGDISPYSSAILSAAKLGQYVFDWKRQPVRTWLYGNVQQGFTPNSAPTGTTLLETTWESLYSKGTVLPGLGQAQ
jgi:hypothetical protein